MSLNPGQERALTVALRLLEERLARVEDIIRRGESGRLYRRPRLSLSRTERARIDAILVDLRATIASVADAHRLPCEERDPIREISGLMSVSWESLAEVESRGLRSYGRVDPGLRDSLDPALERMLELVTTLEWIGRRRDDDQADRPGAARAALFELGKTATLDEEE